MSKRNKKNIPNPMVSKPEVNIPAKVREAQNKMQIQIDQTLVTYSEDEKGIIAKLQENRKSKILLLIAGDNVHLNDDIAPVTFDLLSELGKQERIDMILSSRGGRTEVPAKLVPLIRNYCDEFRVIIPYRAHSAATHIALGANEIVMGPMSELGPVDPSRTHPLLPKDKDGNQIPISVQDLKHVVDLLKREGPEQSYTPEALATIFSKMFEYVHPLAMGAIEQSYALAKIISKKLLTTHMDPIKDQDKIERITNELSDGFKSHSYQIGWKEAQDLGLPVTFDNDEVYKDAWKLYQLYSKTLDPLPGITPGMKAVSRPILLLGTEKSKSVLFEISEIHQEGTLSKLQPVGTKWISSHEIKIPQATMKTNTGS